MQHDTESTPFRHCADCSTLLLAHEDARCALCASRVPMPARPGPLFIPDMELLASVGRELARTSRTAEDYAAMRAFDKAAYHLERGVVPVLSDGDILVPSATTAGQVYRVSGVGCSCQAGLKGKECWHAALVEVIATAWQRLGEADDGDADGADVSRVDDVELPFVPSEAEIDREHLLALIYEEADDWYMAA